MALAEQEVYLPQRQRLEEARQRHRDAQKRLAQPEIRVPVS